MSCRDRYACSVSWNEKQVWQDWRLQDEASCAELKDTDHPQKAWAFLQYPVHKGLCTVWGCLIQQTWSRFPKGHSVARKKLKQVIQMQREKAATIFVGGSISNPGAVFYWVCVGTGKHENPTAPFSAISREIVSFLTGPPSLLRKTVVPALSLKGNHFLFREVAYVWFIKFPLKCVFWSSFHECWFYRCTFI